MDPISFVTAFALAREPQQPAPKTVPPTPSAMAPQNEPTQPKNKPCSVTQPPQKNEDPPRQNMPAITPMPNHSLANPQPSKIKEKLPELTKNTKMTPEPRLWQLSDAAGYLWTSPDLLNLQHYVAARNAALTQPPVLYSTSGACSGGRCYR